MTKYTLAKYLYYGKEQEDSVMRVFHDENAVVYTMGRDLEEDLKEGDILELTDMNVVYFGDEEETEDTEDTEETEVKITAIDTITIPDTPFITKCVLAYKTEKGGYLIAKIIPNGIDICTIEECKEIAESMLFEEPLTKAAK